MHTASAVLKAISAATTVTGGAVGDRTGLHGRSRWVRRQPGRNRTDGGTHAARTGHMAGTALSILSDILEIGAGLSNTIGSWQHRKDNWNEAATEAQIQMRQAQAQTDGATLALEIAQRNVDLHQEQIDNLQKQIDFLNDKFTSDSLYDWMVSSLVGHLLPELPARLPAVQAGRALLPVRARDSEQLVHPVRLLG